MEMHPFMGKIQKEIGTDITKITMSSNCSANSASTEVSKKISFADKLKVLWRLVLFAKPEYFRIALGLAGLTINAVTNLSFPWLIGQALDKSTFEGLTTFLLKNSYFFLAGTVASWVRIYCLGSATESISNRLRVEIFDSFLQQDMRFYESLEMGEVISLLENDVQLASELLTEKLGSLLRSLNSSINGSIALYRTSPQLCSISLSIVPVVGIAAMTLARYSTKLATQLREAQSKILSYSLERIRCISTVRLHQREIYEHQQFQQLTSSANQLSNKRFHVHGSFMSFINLFTNLSLIAVLQAGGQLVANGTMTVGGLTSFAIQSGFVGLGFAGLATFYSDIRKAIDSLQRIFTILDLKQELIMQQSIDSLIKNNDHDSLSSHNNNNNNTTTTSTTSPSLPLTPTTATTTTVDGIYVDHVSFHYTKRSDICVLQDITLHFPIHTITCIIGKSGSGKSTLASLLCGLYHPNQGSISFFGQVITNNDNHTDKQQQQASQQIYTMCGVVEQSGATLFSGSIYENIAYGKDSCTREEVIFAAKAAHCHEFITTFPTQYETDIGESGKFLSGGQRARIALARALIKQPKFLILDEPTAALDYESEQAVLEPLITLKSHTTIIIVTHSEALKNIADHVYEIQNGKIISS
jgi:ABC-type multidrug transport system fused ATPase/permease subunit